MYFGVITGMVAFFIIAAGSVIIFIRYQKKILQQQAAIHSNELKYKEDLLLSNIKSVEEERKRIAKDIHDELGGIFSILSLTFNQFAIEGEGNQKLLTNSRSLVDTGLKSVRRIAHAIIPDELELFGLDNAIENYVSKIDHSTGLEIEYTNSMSNIRMLPDTELALYRIIQELVSNTIKHAQASKVKIVMELNAGEGLVCYQDNGVGSVSVDSAVYGGMGLRNIESRLIILQGKVEFVSLPNRGYHCILRFPLPQSIINDTYSSC